jgi:hypothetical protein
MNRLVFVLLLSVSWLAAVPCADAKWFAAQFPSFDPATGWYYQDVVIRDPVNGRAVHQQIGFNPSANAFVRITWVYNSAQQRYEPQYEYQPAP